MPPIPAGRIIWLRFSARYFPGGSARAWNSCQHPFFSPSSQNVVSTTIPGGRGESSPVQAEGGGGSAGRGGSGRAELLSPTCSRRLGCNSSPWAVPTRAGKLLAQLWDGSHQVWLAPPCPHTHLEATFLDTSQVRSVLGCGDSGKVTAQPGQGRRAQLEGASPWLCLQVLWSGPGTLHPSGTPGNCSPEQPVLDKEL